MDDLLLTDQFERIDKQYLIAGENKICRSSLVKYCGRVEKFTVAKQDVNYIINSIIIRKTQVKLLIDELNRETNNASELNIKIQNIEEMWLGIVQSSFEIVNRIYELQENEILLRRPFVFEGKRYEMS